MPRLCCILAVFLAAALHAAEPLTSRKDAVGHALNEWFEAGKAAGFEALQYENRDGNHSPLPPEVYPTLRHFHSPDTGPQTVQEKGPATAIRTTPTIGNCSMASPADASGSIPRLATMERGGSEFLFRQYLAGNLFIYPEHQDYDAGANGVGGWGDMYAVNSPCLLISQGSSYSDMPFVKALLATAAAMPPAVQRQLIRDRILCPTLQALLRQNTTLVSKDEDYFTGRAHPPVFDASAIDELKMVTAAQLLTPLTIPPLAFVEVLSERSSKNGRDYFERGELSSEAIATTPSFVGRAFRGSGEVLEMRVSAKRSVDTEKRPLIYRWALLQGDPDRVEITPAEDGREALIKVRWHPPFHTSGGLRTHRVDIGLFVRSPLAVSAPAIISISMLPNEMRFFDDKNRLTEICYEAGDPDPGLPAADSDLRWLTFIQAAAVVDSTLSYELVREALSTRQREACVRVWNALKDQKAALDKLAADPAQKTATEKMLASLGQNLATALKADVGGTSSKKQKQSLRETAVAAIEKMAAQPGLFLDHQDAIFVQAGKSSVATALPDLRAELKRLTSLGVLIEDGDAKFRLGHGRGEPAASDRHYLRQLHLIILSQVLLPGFLQRSPAPLYVDPRLGSPKSWRDVFRYNEEGVRTGWMRYFQGRTSQFDAEGRYLGADEKPEAVTYRLEAGHLVFDTPSK